MKVKNQSSLLLLFLVINCNFKPQADLMFKDNLPGKGSVKVRPPISSSLENTSVKANGVDVAEENIEVKLDKLLGTFMLEDNEGEVIRYVRSVATDSGVGASGDQAYTDDGFYNLLKSLGALKLKEMIEVHLKITKVQDEALIAIENINNEELKQKLQREFDDYKNNYLSHLKELFSGFIPSGSSADNVHYKAINSGYEGYFTSIENQARDFMDGANLYAELPAAERSVIDYIQGVVTNPAIGSANDYRTYSVTEFTILLGSLGDSKLAEIIEFHLGILKAKDDALAVIKDVKRDEFKQKLQNKFNACNDAYPSHLKGLFHEFAPDRVYSRVINSNYADSFAYIANQAGSVMQFEKIYEGLSDDGKAVIDYIRGIVVTSGVGDDDSADAYTDDDLYALLSNLDALKLKEIIEVYLEIERVQKEASDAIEDIKKEELKKQLKREFDVYNEFYLSDLKSIFVDGYDPGSVHNRTVNGEHVDKFTKIRDDARSAMGLENLYVGLSADEQLVIEHIRSAVSNPNIGHISSNTYTDDEFYSMLVNLGALRLKEIIEVYLDIYSAREDALRAIENINKEDSKQELKREYDDYNNIYLSDIKWAFSGSTLDDVYDNIMDIDYKSDSVDGFTAIKDQAISLK
ncbi:Hypothetical protein BHY_1140 (plasmid) [Borrelia nietonii YOR]|uniref:Uncharacterized protein n=2 Tax=Borrelia TaxID=138 RepID=W5SG27_9SPIR|nr:Hypothetical protein BHY_1140 [Borrelia nietonii YOR]